MTDISTAKIIELSNLVRQQFALESEQIQERAILETLKNHSDKTYLGLCGPRGAGKTYLLKQYFLQDKAAIYISLDTLPSDFDIFESIKILNQSYNFKTFLLDEVHFNKGIDKALKNSFDFLQVRIIFTSSVALKMFRSAVDLSRRVKLININYFSLREFLLFNKQISLNLLSLEEILYGELNPQYATCDQYFKEYLEGGILPLSLEVRDWKAAINNILKRVVLEDIPRVYKINLEETEVIFKAIKFIGISSVDGINPASLAKNLSITNYKAEQYLELLEQAFIVYRVMPKGTNVLREPKVLLNIPYRLLYLDYQQAIGGLREEFVVGALKQLGIEIFYIKNSRGKKLPDYIIENNSKKILLEVGGKSKGTSQFKEEDQTYERFVLKDSAPYDKDRRPLVGLGLLS